MSHYATLAVNLSALCDNYKLLKKLHAKNNIAAVVKANAYGLGVAEVSKTLAREGCKLFFVATLDEAIELRAILPTAKIAVLNGIFKSEEQEFRKHNIIPIVNNPSQLEFISGQNKIQKEIFIHYDSGMTRLGFSLEDITNYAASISNCTMILSHLACASDLDHPKNSDQLLRLNSAIKYFPKAKVSFVNSAGHFLPPEYHFDIGRPGCSLYGINPLNESDHKTEFAIKHVATLSAPILQISKFARNEQVGYGAEYEIKKGGALAIAAIGYADGYFRSLGNRGFAFIENYKVPIAGRISMDMIALDISNVPEQLITYQSRAELINEQQNVDDIARKCQTIGYEIFSRIGSRVKRIYTR